MRKTGGPPRSREGYHWFRGWRKPTAAQRRVLDELLAGGTNAQIAARLGISEDGVKWHLSELRDEVGLADRRELAEWWAAERQRPAVNLLFPFAALWRFATQNAAASLAVVSIIAISLAIGWFAYDSLRGDDDALATTAPVATPERAASVPFIPTPTPTPAPTGALMFDVAAGEARILPGDFFDRRWFDADSLTFTVNDGGRPAFIDAEGEVRVMSERTTVSIQPVPAEGGVVLWGWGDGRLSVVDSETMRETVLVEFGPAASPGRNWALSAITGRIALSEPPYDAVTVYDLDGSNPRVVFTAGPDEEVWFFDWTRDGEWFLVVTSRGPDPGSRTGSRSVVLDATGNVILEHDERVRWAGDAALQLYRRDEAAGGASVVLDAVIDVAHQGTIPIPDGGTLVCVSPDNRHAVLGTAVGDRSTRHELYDLVAREVIAEAVTNRFLTNCDWTPDGSKVVLSGGGK